jgi:hypothetical protein
VIDELPLLQQLQDVYAAAQVPGVVAAMSSNRYAAHDVAFSVSEFDHVHMARAYVRINVCKEFAVLEKAACTAGKAGKTLLCFTALLALQWTPCVAAGCC